MIQYHFSILPNHFMIHSLLPRLVLCASDHVDLGVCSWCTLIYSLFLESSWHPTSATMNPLPSKSFYLGCIFCCCPGCARSPDRYLFYHFLNFSDLKYLRKFLHNLKMDSCYKNWTFTLNHRRDNIFYVQISSH